MKAIIKERPIIFSGESVRAILDGRKTQTRRVIKPQPGFVTTDSLVPFREFGGKPILCPYGQPGDHLWARETWTELVYGEKAMYRADAKSFSDTITWTPSIFMPRWASRITLEIMGVRVERLQKISKEDAKAEGCHLWYPKSENLKSLCYEGSYRNGYHELWDSLNAKRGYPWESDPFVWVIEFNRRELP